MQANGRNPQHNYTNSYQSNSSAASFSYGHERMNSLSRSESRSSRTHYEDFTNTPSPKVMTDYARNSLQFDFDQQPHNQGRSQRMAPDPVAFHLLVETAVGDSADYDVLTVEELEELKKEEAKLNRQVPGLRRELALETKYRDAAQGLNQVNSRNDRNRGSTRMSQDEYATSVRKCDTLANDLYRAERRLFDVREQRLRHTAGILQMEYQRRDDQAAFNQANGFEDSEDWDSGFSLTAFAPGGLADTEDGIMDIPGGRDPHTDATLQDLWSVLNSNDELLGTRDMSNGNTEEEFSIEAFSEKVQMLCSRAAELSYDLDSEREARNVTESAQHSNRAELMQQLQAAKDKHQQIQDDHAERIKGLEQEKSDTEARHQEVEAEMIRLQTEVTVAKAELDGAYGSRAQRQAEQAAGQQEIDEAKGKVDTLQRELQDLVTEHEALTQQGIEAEREREKMESMIDSLREKLETVEVKLHEERVHRMGRGSGPTSAVSTPATGGAPKVTNAEDATSLRVMRSEFKKMMRDARAEHFRMLKTEQDERRRLESTIRSMRKDQGTASNGPNSPSTMLSPPPLGRSGLGRNVSNAA